MGKVVKAVAVIAIAAAIAYLAPTLGLQFAQLAAAGATAGSIGAVIATAVVATALSAAASFAFRTLLGPPSATCRLMIQSGSLGPLVDETETAPRGRRGWSNPIFLPKTRFAIEPVVGDCMSPLFSQGWAIVDREASIRAGDLVVIRVSDQRAYYFSGTLRVPRDLGRVWFAAIRSPMVKRFAGVGEGRLAFEHTNPPATYDTDLEGVDVLYRIRSFHPTLWAACRTFWRVRNDPNAYDQRLCA